MGLSEGVLEQLFRPDGLQDPQMSRRRGVQIAGSFAIFQAVMPMTGWVCVHTIVELFSSFETQTQPSMGMAA